MQRTIPGSQPSRQYGVLRVPHDSQRLLLDILPGSVDLSVTELLEEGVFSIDDEDSTGLMERSELLEKDSESNRQDIQQVSNQIFVPKIIYQLNLN